MTLGQWFCRYVYVPLGGNRKGEWRTLFNLLCVWLLTAVWHGSTPNFLIWGMMLWFLIVMERQLGRLGMGKLFSWGILKVIPHFYLWFVIVISWMCFAITDLSQLEMYLGRMFGVTEGIRVGTGDWRKALMNYGVLLAVGGLACTPAVEKLFRKLKDRLPGMLLLMILFLICVW